MPVGGVAILFCNVIRANTSSSSTFLEIFWLDSNNDVISNASDLAVFGPTKSHDTNTTSRLTVSNIRTSQAGVYSCVVNMTIPGVVEDHQVRESSTVYVKGKVKSDTQCA